MAASAYPNGPEGMVFWSTTCPGCGHAALLAGDDGGPFARANVCLSCRSPVREAYAKLS